MKWYYCTDRSENAIIRLCNVGERRMYMKQRQQLDLRERANQTNSLYYFLLIIAFLDFLLIVLPNNLSTYQDKIMLIPNLLFISIVVLRDKTKVAKQVFTLGAIMFAWYTIAQLLHYFAGLRVRPFSVFTSVYLVALPFASVTQDGEQAKGLKGYASLYAAGMIGIIGYACMVLTKHVPWFLETYVHSWKNGIYLISHPSQMGGILLAGFFLALAMLCVVKSNMHKVILAFGLFLILAVLSMTMCKAAIWMACILFGVFIFLAISKGGLVRLITGLVVAVVVVTGARMISKGILSWGWEQMFGTPMPEQYFTSQTLTDNTDIRMGDYQIYYPQTIASNGRIILDTGRLRAIQASGTNHSNRIIGKNNLAVDLQALSFQLPRLNGRTPRWIQVFSAIGQKPEVIIRGTDYRSYFMLDYDGTEMAHMHNSWFEVLTALGLPGLLIVVFITIIAFWHVFAILFGREYELWKKCIALLVIALMGVGAMEPHLFLGGHFLPGGNNLHPIDFTFFLATGYLVEWRAVARKQKKKMQICPLMQK